MMRRKTKRRKQRRRNKTANNIVLSFLSIIIVRTLYLYISLKSPINHASFTGSKRDDLLVPVAAAAAAVEADLV